MRLPTRYVEKNSRDLNGAERSDRICFGYLRDGLGNLRRRFMKSYKIYR